MAGQREYPLPLNLVQLGETLGMAIYMGAGPSAMYASHAIEAFDQFAALKE